MDKHVSKSLLAICIIIFSSAYSARTHADNSPRYTPPVLSKIELVKKLKASSNGLFRGFNNPIYRPDIQIGWVDLTFIVDRDGNVFEVTVLDSSGDRSLEKSAKRAVLNSVHQPASIGEHPVASEASLRLRRRATNSELSVGEIFGQRYQAVISAIKNEEERKAKNQLRKLTDLPITNLYEDAFLNIAKFELARAFDTDHRMQIKSLERALNGNDQEEYLPSNLYAQGLASLFTLKVDARDYRGAQQIYQKLVGVKGSEAYVKELEKVMQEIHSRKQRKASYKVPASINSRKFWRLPIFTNNFTISDVDGTLNKIKLMCSQRYIETGYSAKSDYSVPESFGDCFVMVYGKVGTTFNFWQF